MKALVTGGGGFLGRAIIRKLAARGDRIVSFSRSAYPDLEALGIRTVRGDLSDLSALINAASGCDIVFHVAAKAGVWGSFSEFYRINVQGTENVVEACRQASIKKLVYTSTPSVIHSGKNVEGADESTPYAETFEAPYPQTKTRAERFILSVNGPDLATVALRPHLIWGPGDPHFIPRLISRAKSGRLRLISGGPYLVDCVYVDNAADAHILAADRVSPGASVSGKAYFITQGEPMDVRELINLLIGAAGLPPVTKTVPPWLAVTAGKTIETIYRWLGFKQEPPMTAFLARQLCTSHWFSIESARRDLGYAPQISIAEGIKRLREYLQPFGY